MIFERLVVGPFGVNCYIWGDENTHEAIIIDPGGNARDILAAIKQQQLEVKVIVNTHAHFDHVVALNDIRAATHAPFLLHADDASILAMAQKNAASFGLHIPQPAPADRLLHDGDEVQVSGITLRVQHTPGHTPGGICLLGDKVVFTGDTLFQAGIGRTDLPGGDYGTLMRSIGDKLLALPADTVVYPGHGDKTSIGAERQLNPFLRPLITGRWVV